MNYIISYLLMALLVTGSAFSIAGNKGDWRKCMLVGTFWPISMIVSAVVFYRTK